MVCSKERVARLMREMELVAKVVRKNPRGTKRRRGASVAPNLLNRDFRATAPNVKWVSDTTYVWTTEGWLSVAIILDVFSRLVVGWAMGATNDEDLVRRALEMALVRRAPPPELLLHSDQGRPYTATGILPRLERLGMGEASHALATVMITQRWKVSSAHSRANASSVPPFRHGKKLEKPFLNTLSVFTIVFAGTP